MKTNTPLQNLVSRVADRLSPRNDSSALAEKSPRPLVIEALEPRILFSGSPAPAPEAAPAESPAAQESAEAAPEESAPASEEASVAAPPAASRSGEAASSSEAGSGDTAITLTDTELSALSEAASSIWASSGLTEEQVAALSSASYQISDLGGKILGSAEGNLITIDDDAAGRGWFVDGTPEEDSEFAPGGSATTGVDLLSVLLHEQGHLLGLDDGVAAAGDVMFEAIGLGERRLPDVGEAAGAVAGSLEGVHLITFSGVEDFEGEAGSTFSDPGGTSTFTAGGGLLVSAAGGYGSGASGTFLDIGFGNTVAAPASLGSIAIEAGHSFEVTSLDIALTSDDGTDDPNADTANVDSMLTITGVRFGGGADVVATVTVNSDTAGGYVTLDQAGELAPFAGIQLSSLEFDLPAGSPATFIYIDNFGFTSDDSPGGVGGGTALVPITGLTASNGKNNFGGELSDLTSGEEITKPDANDPSTWTAAGGAYQNEWQAQGLLSGATNNKIAWAALDLGSETAGLDSLYLWNIRQGTGQNARTVTYNVYYASSPTVTLPAAPTNNTVIDYDFSSGGWTQLGGTLTMPQRGADGSPADQVVDLGGVSARYIGLEIITNGGSASRAGFSEVAVTATPPATGPDTTMTMELSGSNGEARNSWNNPANWDNGIPTGTNSAAVADGIFADVWNSNNDTPTFSGGLTLGVGSTLQMGWTTQYATDGNALGTGTITMKQGSQIIPRTSSVGTYTFNQNIVLEGDGTIWGGISTSNHHTTKTFASQISGSGQLILEGVNNNTFHLDTANTMGGFVAQSTQNQGFRVEANTTGSLGTGDVTISGNATLQIDAVDVIDDGGSLVLDGVKDSRRATKLIINANDTVDTLFIDGIQAAAGTYTGGDGPWISGGGTLTVLNGPAASAPTLASSDFVDDVFGGPVYEDVGIITYTLTFSKDMDASTITAADFENAGTATISIGAITKTGTPPLPSSPSTFTVEVTPSTAGTLQLQVKAGADLRDTGGLALDTSSAIADDTIITINSGNTPPSTITGTAGGADSWNVAANWDTNTVPFGPGSAIVDAGVLAQVTSASTPSYTGTLTLEASSTLQIRHRDAISVLHTPSDITLNDGATIDILDGSPTFGDIELVGDTRITLRGNGAHHETVNFGGVISGSGGLFVNGVNNDTFNISGANTFGGGFSTLSDANQGYRINAQSDGAFGMGDVTIGAAGTLEITSGNSDTIGDAGILSLDGIKDSRRTSKLILGSNETVAGFFIDGVDQGTGTFGATGSGADTELAADVLSGSGILTVAAAPPSGIDAVDDDYTATNPTDEATVLTIDAPGVLANDVGVGVGPLTTQLGILDLSANGGINPATGEPWEAGDTYRLVFVTSTRTTGDQDIAFYNNFVQTHADASSLGLGAVSWSAIASTASVNALANTGTDPAGGTGESIWLTNGTEIIADNYADLWDGSQTSAEAIDRTENNTAPPTWAEGWGRWSGTWTGTNGTGATSNPLGDGGVANLGLANGAATAAQWVARSNGPEFDAGNDNDLNLVYGISEVLTVAGPPGAAISAFDAVSANGATVNVNSNGSFEYDPTGSATLQALDDGQSITDTFTYTISDGSTTTEVFADSFEDPDISGQPTQIPTGWSRDGANGGMADRAESTDGAQHIWANGPSAGGPTTFHITLGEEITEGTTYTLTVDVFQTDNFTGSEGTIRLFGSDAGFGTAIAENAGIAPPQNGALLDQTVTFTATAAHATGQDLGIALVGSGGIQARFDNVRLTAESGTSDTATVSILVNGLSDLRAVDDDYTASNPTDEDTVLTIASAPNTLLTLDSMATGDHSFTADGVTFDARVEQHDGAGWLLIGRGREGWDFDTDGQGAVADVNQGLGTSSAFVPAAYTDAMINDLLADVGLTMGDVEIRISRASAPDGTGDYQDVRWRDFTAHGTAGTGFTWDFENNNTNRYGVTQEIRNAPAGLAGAEIKTVTGTNTYDSNGGGNGNDADRVFTWAWGSHNNQKGFSYGQSVANGSNSPTSFLWESGNENHAIPYAEVYIRALNGTQTAATQSILDNDLPPGATIVSFDATSDKGAVVAVNPDGTFTYDPTGSATLQALQGGDSVTDTFTYTITDAAPAGPAALTAGANVLVSENNANFNISVFDGKARYDNSGTGAYTNPPLVTTPFGDGTVEDYNFVVSRNGMTDPLSYASGGAGLTPDPYDPNPGTGGYSNNSGQQWANVWTTSDPDTAPKDFVSGAINTTHAGHGEIQGTVDISGLKSGTVYFPHGTFINNWTIQVVMSGGGQPDLTATKTQGGNGPGQNFGWITDFTFDNAEYYDTITYTYTNGDLDGSRARFMGVILDGVPISGTDTATVTVSVNGVNDAPVAVDDHGAVTETADAITDPQATGNVLANDTDVDNVTADFILLEVDGDANNVGNAIAGTYGSVVINSDGSYTYTLDDADPDTQALQEGETVTETFEYTMTDSPSILSTDFSNDSLNGWTVLNGVENFSGNGISASQSGGNFAHDGAHETFLVESPTNFTIGTATVDGTNALSVVFDGGQGSQGGSVAPFANPAAALEFNGGNSATDGLKGLAFLNTATGQYDATVFDPSNGGGNQTVNMTAAQLQSAGVDLNASYRLHYYENDQGSWGWTRLNSVQVANTPVTDTATLTVTVTGANDSPIATDNTAAVTEDNAISDSGNVISDDDGGGADSDVDNATLTVTDVGGTAITTNTVVGGTHGDLTISGDGSYTYDLDNPAAQSLAAGETATDTFTYTVSDMAVGYNPGLVAGTVPGSFNTTDANSGNAGISLDLSEANNGIAGNTTEVYTGQFYDADGVVSFREHIDDATYLMIDGQVVLNNSQWNVETNSGTLNLTPGWVDFELRVGNGGGGNGPVGGIGFEYDPDGGTNWSKIQDGAGSSILRYGVPAPATDTADLTVTVTGVNDAPVLSGANDFDGVVVDDADNDGNAVSELTGTITDVDNGALIGAIAVTGTSVSVPGAAVFQYSHNGGAWTDIGAVDANNGLLLFSTDRIRFSPNGTQQVTGSIDFKAWDQTGATAGLEGTKVDTVPDGGESAFSTAIATSAAYTVNVTIDNGTLQYGEEEGREDKVTIWSDGTSVFIRDANGPITTDDGVQVDPNTVSFMITDFEDILFEANDFDDTITVGDMPGFDGSLTIDGEEGFDTVTFAGGMTLALGTGTQNGTDENLDVDAETVKIDLDASLSVVGGGTIDITATGGGAEDVVGIQLRRAGLSSEDGAITLVGEGGSSGNHNDGVLLSHGSSITTGGGSVSITGTATSAAGPNDGVSLVGGSDITVGGAGTITITGTSNGASDSYGVQLFTGTELTSAEGDISLAGGGNGTGARNSGIYTNGATVTTTGAGSISLDGEGSGGGTNSKGLRLTGSTLEAAGTGGITLTGTGGGGTSSNVGVEVGVRTSVTTASGDVTITGEGAGSATRNAGVSFLSRSSVDSGGGITVTGTGGDGTSHNDGVSLVSATLDAGGDISVTGVGAGSGNYNRGIDSTRSSFGGGEVTLTGTGTQNGGGSARFGDGVYLNRGGATAAGTLTIGATGGTGSSNNRGLYASGVTLGGTLAVTGTADAGTTGSGNSGVYIQNSTLGAGTILGTAGGGTGSFGAHLQNITGGIAPGDVTTGPDDDEEKSGNFFNVLPALVLAAGADRVGRKRREQLAGLIGRLGESAAGEGEMEVYREEDGIIGLEATLATVASLEAAGVEVPAAGGGTRRVLVLTGGGEGQATGVFASVDGAGKLVSTSSLKVRGELTAPELMGSLADGDCEGWSQVPRETTPVAGTSFSEAFGIE